MDIYYIVYQGCRGDLEQTWTYSLSGVQRGPRANMDIQLIKGAEET